MSTLAPAQTSRFATVLAAGLTFALGAGWYALHRASSPPAPAPGAAPASGDAASNVSANLPPEVIGPATIAQAEQYFATWGGYAVWADDVTEFALWSAADRDYTQCFEVRRGGGKFTFRRIARLTRPLIDHGQAVRSPMAFTETQAMRDAFYRANPHYSSTRPTWAPTAPADRVPDLPPRPPVGRATTAPETSAARQRDRALVLEFSEALARTNLPPANQHTSDLLALFQLYPVAPVAPQATAAEITQAVAQRRAANESVLTMATALLTPAQLEVFRGVLQGQIAALEARRRY